MGYGLYIANEMGETLIDTSSRFLKILGHFTVPAGTKTTTLTATHELLGQGDFFYYAQGNCFNLHGTYVTTPVALYAFTPTIEGNTLSLLCEYAAPYRAAWLDSEIETVDVVIYYGVY